MSCHQKRNCNKKIVLCPAGPQGPQGLSAEGAQGPQGPQGTLECFTCSVLDDTCDDYQLNVLEPITMNDDTGVVVETLGNGPIQREVPTPGDPAGGNCRGNLAVDWQSRRNDPTQVASGRASFIGNGFGNTASGRTSFIGTGDSNTADAFDAFIGNGFNNVASTVGATIVNGFQNSITQVDPNVGSDSVIAAGVLNVITDSITGSIAGGTNNEVSSNNASIGGGTLNQVFADAGFAVNRNNLVQNVIIIPPPDPDSDPVLVTNAQNSVAVGRNAHAHMEGSVAHSSFASTDVVDSRGRCQYVRILTQGSAEQLGDPVTLLNATGQRLTFPFHPDSGEAIVTASIIGNLGACVKLVFCVSFDGTNYVPDNANKTIVHSRGFVDPLLNIQAQGGSEGFTVVLDPEDTPQRFCGTFKITMIADTPQP